MENKKQWYEFWKESPKPIEKNNNNEQRGVYSFNRDLSWDNNANYSQPYINKFNNNGYVLFGSDNLFPSLLIDLYNSSPFHAAIIEFKTKAVKGDGIEILGLGTSLEDQITKGKIENFLNRNFVNRVIQEFLIHKRNAFKVIKTENGSKSHKVELIGAEKIRINADGNIFYYSEDWRLRRSVSTTINAYDKYNKEAKEQILHFQTLAPGQEVYAIPSYTSAGNWIALDSNISYFQKQNLENSINPAAIITLFQTITNKTEQDAFVNDLKRSYAGAKNAGKVMVLTAKNKETQPEVKMMEANALDESFMATQESIIKNVSYAHNINPILLGVSTAGSLGQTQELNTAFKIFNQIVLESTQDDIEYILNELLEVAGFKAQVKIKRKSVYLVD